METPKCANCGATLADIEEVCEACEGGLIEDSPTLAWSNFADEVGGEFIEEEFKVFAPFEHWTIELETAEVIAAEGSNMHTRTYTRMTAPFVSKEEFRFKVYRAGLFSGVGRLIGMQDIKVGYQDFDRDFVVKGNDEAKTRAFLSNPRIVELIQAQPPMQLSVERPRSGSDDEAELRLDAEGTITNNERLHQLYELAVESIDQLRDIGSASDDNPAIEDYTRSIELDPEDVDAYYRRGIAYSDRENFKQAIDDFSRVVQLDPEDADAYYSRGLAYGDLGEFERAVGDFDRIIRLDPEDADAYYQRGLARAELGRLRDATADLEKARQRTSDLDLIVDLDDVLQQLQSVHMR